MEFARREYWGRLPFPIQGDLPNPRIEPVSLVSHASAFSVSQISLSFLLKSHQTLSLGRIHPESRMIFILVSLITSAESLFLNQALFTDTGGQYLDIFTFPGGSGGKESACNVGDLGWIPGSGRSPGERNGYSLQYFCLGEVHG